MKKTFYIFSFILLLDAPLNAQLNISGNHFYQGLNNPGIQASYSHLVGQIQKGTKISGFSTIPANIKDKLGSNYLAANKQTEVAYEIPMRVWMDWQLLKNQLEDRIMKVEHNRTMHQQAYDNASDEEKEVMDQYGHQKVMADFDKELNKLYGALDDLIYNSDGKLNFKMYKPPVVYAQSRFIDPVTKVPLMRAQKPESDNPDGEYLIQLANVPYNLFNGLPVSTQMVIFKK